MKTYIINLKRSQDRRTYILKEVAKYSYLDVELVEAVDGLLLTVEEKGKLYDPKAFVKRNGREATLPEIGCTASHKKCYRQFLSTDEPVALILEDDAHFVCLEAADLILEQSFRILGDTRASILLLVPHTIHYTKGAGIAKGYSVHSILFARVSCAYLINRKAAERLLQGSDVDSVADDFVAMIRKGVQVKTICPHLVEGLSDTSMLSEISDNEANKRYQRKPLLYRISQKLFFGYLSLLFLFGAVKTKGRFTAWRN